MAWAKLITSTSAGSSSIDSGAYTNTKFQQFLSHRFENAAIDYEDVEISGNTGSVYANRYSTNGGADSTGTSDDGLFFSTQTVASDTFFTVCYGMSISGEEKLFIHFTINQSTAGAANAPARSEHVSKFVPSPDEDVDQVNIVPNNGTGSYLTGSNISVIGSD